MIASTIYYSAALAPWKESLENLLNTNGYPLNWCLVSHVKDCPIESYALIAKQDLHLEELPLLAARRVLILVDNWSFSDSLYWIRKGAKHSVSLHDVEQIAAWLVSVFAIRDRARLSKQEADSMLQTVIDAIPVPIFYKDEFHIYRGCNQAFSQFIGVPVDKIVNHSVYDIAAKGLADIYYQADCELLVKGGSQVYEATVCDAQGTANEIEFNKAVFYKENGDKGGQVGAMLNITERNQLMRQLDNASRTDPLTGIGNRRGFDLVVKEALKHAQSRTPPSLLIIDLDYFKQINDAFGHASGDDALLFVVECLQSQLPENATLFRIGGEEFYALLPETLLPQAQKTAEKLRQYLPNQALEIKGTSVHMTISIGVIQLSQEAKLNSDLKRVDQALYQAKNTGRNKVCVASAN